MADGNGSRVPATCAHPGCGAPPREWIGIGARPKYCGAHATTNLGRTGHRYPRVQVAADGRRSEAAIRADLAAQLTAQVRRFNSMVAHDAATDPLR